MINIYGKGGHARMIASLTEEAVSFYDDSDYYKAKDLLCNIESTKATWRRNIRPVMMER